MSSGAHQINGRDAFRRVFSFDFFTLFLKNEVRCGVFFFLFLGWKKKNGNLLRENFNKHC